ncbi:MAG: 6,7-dimethyl-8-ribityllumazine synthase [Pirellula sp.]
MESSQATALREQGPPQIAPQRIAIVVSTYNHRITDKLCKAAVETLLAAGIHDDLIHILKVPGAWELVFGAQQVVQHPAYSGVITLGAVIRGETTHDQHINRAVSMGLMELSIHHNKPIAFGLLTVNTLEQAIQRSGGNVGNKGEEAATALLECLKLSKEVVT